MPTDSRTPDEIERDIERERTELSETMDALQDKFSPDAIIREIADGFRRHGGEFGSAVSQSVKQNPVALAITGVGLAWLMFGRSHEDPAHAIRDNRRRYSDDLDEPSGYGAAHAPNPSRGDVHTDSYGTTGAYGKTTGSYSRTSGRTAMGARSPSYPDWARHDLDDYDDSHGDDGRSMGSRAADAARGVSSGAKGAADSASSSAKSAAGSVSSGASAAADSAGRAARNASDRLARARERLARGTEDMSDTARERIVAARARAVEMAERADAAARRNYARGRDAVADFVEEQPLVAGAIALAVGAALAGALPRTRREDEALGEARDDLFDEAERIFRQERQKAERVATAAMDEAGKIAKEKREAADKSAPGEKSAVEAAADEVRDAGKRVGDAAEREARKEDLGNPRRS